MSDNRGNMQKELIINLIHQDLKHSQLLLGLQYIGLDGSDVHHLGILEIVSDLMKAPKGMKGDRWGEAYISFMEQATKYEITSRGEALKPLAEACYRRLNILLKDEGKRKG